MPSVGDSNITVMWAPVVAFSCILAMVAILLSLPFLLTRARRLPALNRVLGRLSHLMGAPWSPVDEHQPQHVRKPLSRTARNSLAVSQYKLPKGTAVAAAAATIDCEAQSEDADSCPICFCEYSEGQSVITLPCKHFFHKECISRWLKRDATCPMCKHDLQETAEHHSSSAASTAAGSSSITRSSGTGQPASAAAAARPAAGAVVAGVPAATGSPASATAAAAGVQTAASSAVAGAQCCVAEPVQLAGEVASSSTPAPPREAVGPVR